MKLFEELERLKIIRTEFLIDHVFTICRKPNLWDDDQRMIKTWIEYNFVITTDGQKEFIPQKQFGIIYEHKPDKLSVLFSEGSGIWYQIQQFHIDFDIRSCFPGIDIPEMFNQNDGEVNICLKNKPLKQDKLPCNDRYLLLDNMGLLRFPLLKVERIKISIRNKNDPSKKYDPPKSYGDWIRGYYHNDEPDYSIGVKYDLSEPKEVLPKPVSTKKKVKNKSKGWNPGKGQNLSSKFTAKPKFHRR